MKTFLFFVLLILLAAPLRAGEDKPDPGLPAANAMNALGIDLLAKTTPGENALLSPYSIESALAMTFVGAEKKTRGEMAVTLHLPQNADAIHASFSALQKSLEDYQSYVGKHAFMGEKSGTPKDQLPPALLLSVANRVYSQSGYKLRNSYSSFLNEYYGAPPQELDFAQAPGDARNAINDWVSDQTHKRIENLIPADAITPKTRMVLVNAIYFAGTWDVKFKKEDTASAAFHIKGDETADVPMMFQERNFHCAKFDGYTAVALGYIGNKLQFVVLLPDDPKGLPALEAKLTPALLSKNIHLEAHRVKLWLPRFKMQPPLMELRKPLEELGMKAAFDDPAGSANFNGITEDKKNNLYLSAVFHKTYLSVDESGTEAAGSTAAIRFFAFGGGGTPEVPKEIHIDHPFLFAIQDRQTGACLFLGRVTDPR